MIINASFSSNVASAPAGFLSAVQTAVDFFETTFDNIVTLNISFSWANIAGAIGRSVAVDSSYAYATVVQAMGASDPGTVLPARDPFAASGGDLNVTTAEAKALGLASGGSALDGSVTLDSSVAFNFGSPAAPVAGEYNAVSSLEHEISEVMGRAAGSDGALDATPMALFRYTGVGVVDTSSSYAGAYASVDGGLVDLGQIGERGSDLSDWGTSVVGDAFGYAAAGQASSISSADVTLLQALGYSLTPTETQRNGATTLVFSHPVEQYVLSGVYGSVVVTDTVAGRDGAWALGATQQAAFSDYTVVFDLHSSQDLLVYELYQASFDRVPDNAGFRAWASFADASNASATSLADDFLASTEFVAKYGANPDNTTFVTELYTNVLNRAPDAAGLAAWVAYANAGAPRDALLVDFATSAENVALIAQHVSNGFWTT